jgi:3-methylfumaryl-CoA hydratase
MESLESLRDWIGRSQECDDTITPGPLAGLAALLDSEQLPVPAGEVPPLGHWLYFLDYPRQSQLGPDGHARRGDFLPPVPLPRRMWAGGRFEFMRPLRVGERVRRRTVIGDVTHKQGRSGDLVFVRVDHEISGEEGPALREAHDIVYRSPPSPKSAADSAAAAASEDEPADWRREIHPDPVMLFRYSALTFNSHRIHYDREYCREAEGYPGLVVHGPLTGTLLVDLFLRENPGARVRAYSFRALRPLFDTHPFAVCGRPTDKGAVLWALTPDGAKAMSAELESA